MVDRTVAGFDVFRKRARSPVCRCVQEFNANMAELDLNTTLCFELFTGAVVIATEKRSSASRKKPVAVIASYCPFCGKKYEAEDAKAAEAGALHA